MSEELNELRASIRRSIQSAGFTPQQTNAIIEGINILDEHSQALGVISEEVATDLTMVATPLMSMIALNLDMNDLMYEENFELLRMLVGTCLRGAYHMGKVSLVEEDM